jgi:hypothetical protein
VKPSFKVSLGKNEYDNKILKKRKKLKWRKFKKLMKLGHSSAGHASH